MVCSVATPTRNVGQSDRGGRRPGRTSPGRAAWLRAVVQHAFDLVVALDATGTVIDCTPSTARLLARPLDALVGAALCETVVTEDQDRLRRTLAHAVDVPGETVPLDLRVMLHDGSFRWVEASVTSFLDDPAVGAVVLYGRDVTERRLAAARLNYLALHDPLTGLPNRALLRDRLGHALARCHRAGSKVAVCFAAVDRLGLINETRGHPEGDAVLVEVAARCKERVRGGDSVARFGGSVFALLLDNLTTNAQAYRSAQRVLADAFAEPFVVAGSPMRLSASIGVAVGDDRDGVDTLLSGADTAMHVAQRAGGDRVELYERSMRSLASARMDLETALRRALDEDQLTVAYQPVVSTRDRRVTGAEALVRWDHPERGLISPMEFIPLAEETGLIGAVGAAVFDKACAQLRRIQDAHPARAFTMSINIAPAQLGCQRTPRLLHLAERHGVDPRWLVVEITESSLLQGDDALASLHWLRSHGVRIAADDFGTGYCSLSYMKHLPIDILKIDRSFVSGLGADPHDTAIVGAIVAMAEALDLHVVAEGVENETQLELLSSLGCPQAQGFLFSPPVHLDAATAPVPEPWGFAAPALR